MEDKTVKEKYAGLEYSADKLEEYLEQVLQIEAVASKDWLTNKVDRSVSGRIVRQQCVGPLHLPLSEVNPIVSIHDHGAGGGTLQQVHAPHQGALAGAGETDNSEDLPLLDVQADVLQGMDGVFTRSKGLVQVLNLNDRHGITLLSGEFWQ